MKCPCEDCLCVPICRHKRYIPLIKCSILKDYIMKAPLPFVSNQLDIILKILEPTRWTYKYTKHKGRSEPVISISSVQNEK